VAESAGFAKLTMVRRRAKAKVVICFIKAILNVFVFWLRPGRPQVCQNRFQRDANFFPLLKISRLKFFVRYEVYGSEMCSVRF